ncbi:MAG: cupin domain-containing protein [Sphingomonas sp.]
MSDGLPIHAPGALAGPEAILSLGDLEWAVTSGAILPADVKLFVSEREVDPRTAGAAAGDRLSPLALRSFAHKGATLVFNNLQKLNPDFWELACEVEGWLLDPVTIGAIASFGGAGLKLHHDDAELIMLQLSGTKIWEFHGHAAGAPAEPWRITLTPGDLLFVPAGLRHRCEHEGFSLHLGLLVSHATPYHYLLYLARKAKEQGLLQSTLRRFQAPDVLATDLASAGSAIRDLMGRYDIAAWLDESASAKASLTALGLAPGSLDAPGAVATLAVSMPPVRTTDGTLRAGPITTGWSPAGAALIAALQNGKMPVADLVRVTDPESGLAALEALVAAGVIHVSAP